MMHLLKKFTLYLSTSLFFTLNLISLSYSQFETEKEARIWYDKYLTKIVFEYYNEYEKLEDICKNLLPQGKYGKLIKIQDCVWRKEQEILKRKNISYILYNVAYDRYSLMHNLAKQTQINSLNDPNNIVKYVIEYKKKRKAIIIDSISNSFKNTLLNEIRYGDVSPLIKKKNKAKNTLPFEKKCLQLGFKKGTENFGNCVLKLME